jgi:hypothetical protein
VVRVACGPSGARERAAERRRRSEGEKEGGKKKRKGEKKMEERETAGIVAATATGLARTPVGRDAGEQGVGTAMDSDVETGFSGVREIGQGTILNGLSSTIEKRF